MYWWFGSVWSRKSVASAKESSLTYVSISYWLVCHAGINWMERGHPYRKSLFITLPNCPSHHCFVVSSLRSFIYFCCPSLTEISNYQEEKWLGIHYPFVFFGCNNVKNRWSDLLTHWLMTHDSLTHLTHKTCVLTHFRSDFNNGFIPRLPLKHAVTQNYALRNKTATNSENYTSNEQKKASKIN